jgi:hypothetical protein
VTFGFEGMSELFDYDEYFRELASKIGGYDAPVSSTLPITGGGLFLLRCEMPKEKEKQLKKSLSRTARRH